MTAPDVPLGTAGEAHIPVLLDEVVAALEPPAAAVMPCSSADNNESSTPRLSATSFASMYDEITALP